MPNISLDGRAVSLDRYLVMPSFHIHSDPTDEEDDTFQVRHYANKLSGKLYYDSLFEFAEFYRRIYQINKIFQIEGKIIW